MNNTRKRSSMMVRLVAVLAVTMMFTMCFVGGTFAKYTSSATGTDSATVAKWDIRVNGANITTSDTFTFDLFNTVNDTKDNNAETDMAPNGGTIIAPGTTGKFTIKLQNLSEVNAEYSTEYTVTSNVSSIPVQYSLDGDHWTTEISTLNRTNCTIGLGTEGEVTVYWKWDFSTGAAADAYDTLLGTMAAAGETVPVIYVSAKVTATQVD